MIDKGEVIKSVFRRLGKINVYNDNKSDEYITASSAFDDVVNTIAIRTAFLFNATTAKLTAIAVNELGENRFNIPVDNLNIIRANGKYRVEGEFIYSPEKELYIQYCREISLSEYPDYLFDYLVAAVCIEMCLAFNGYQDKLEIFNNLEYRERSKIINQQGFNWKPWE